MSVFIARKRAETDDRHHIRDPYEEGPNAMDIFTNTLLVERIPDLFRTQEGLRGHAMQIQQELNRLANVEGRSGIYVAQAVEHSKAIKHSIEKAYKFAIMEGGIVWNKL